MTKRCKRNGPARNGGRSKTERTIAQGADTAIRLASSPEVEGINGSFFDHSKQTECKFKNMETEEKLWNICERLTASTLN